MCQKARGEYIHHLISPPLTWHDCVQTLLVASNLCALIRKMMIPGSHQLCVKLTVKLFGPSINEAQQSLRPTWEALGKQYILQRKAQNNVDPGLGFSFSEQQRRNIMIYNDIFPQTKNIYDMMSVFHGKGPFWLTRYGTSPNAQIVLAKFVVKMKTRFNHKHPIVLESSLVMQLCRVSGC